MTPLPLLTSLALAAAPQTQVPAGLHSPLAQAAPLPQELLHDVATDGALWTLGQTYKARFDGRSATYIPFLGSDAPRNFPVRFSLSGAEVAGEPLDLTPPATATRRDQLVEIARSGLVEEYRLSLDSIEQAFRFDRLPARGALSVSVDLDSDLEPTWDDSGLTLEGPHGGVHLGAAFAVDARGQRAALVTEPTAKGYRISVPAEFVEGATLPLWIDPVIGTLSAPTLSWDTFDPDVIWFGDTSLYLASVMTRFSSTDHDVFVLRFNDNGGSLGQLTIDFTTEDWREPRIAVHEPSGRFTVVASVDDQFPARQIYSRSWDGQLTPAILLSEPGSSFDCVSPDISGADQNGGNFNVVWEREESPGALHTIRRTFLSFAGIPLMAPTTVLSGSGVVYSRPRLSASGGGNLSGFAARVVLTANRSSGGTLSCVARVLDGLDGDPITGPFSLPALGDSQTNPEPSMLLDGDGNRAFAIAYTANFGGNSDIMVALYRGSSLVSLVDLSQLEGDSGRSESGPTICSDGNRFFIGYVHDVGGNLLQPYAAVLNAVGDSLRLVEGRVPVTTLPGIQATPSVCTKGAAGPTLSEACIVWTVFDGLPRMEGTLFRMTDAIDLGFGTTCLATPNSTDTPAWIALSGSGIAGDPHQVTLQGLPSGQFGFVIAGQVQGDVLFAGGSDGRLCLGGPIGRLFSTINNSGVNGWFDATIDTNSIDQPTGAVAVQPGETWYFQGWFRDGGSSNFTDSVGVTF